MKVRSFACAATAFAVAVSSSLIAVAAAATVQFSFLPQHTGESQAYRYEVDETGPRGTTSVRESIGFAREANDRVKITVTPDGGTPSTLYAIVERDGRLTPASAPTARVAYAGPVNTPAPRASASEPASDPNLPMDRPILGLPAGAGDRQSRSGYPGSGYPAGGYPDGANTSGQRFGRSAAAIPRNVQVVAALIAAARAPQQAPGSFAFSAGVGEPPHVFRNFDPAQAAAPPTPAPASAVQMIAKLVPAKAGETQIVADGSGSVLVAAAGTSDVPRTGGQRGGGQRGGRGGMGGGIGSILFPGGATGGGRGQDGGGRRSPQDDANAGTIPATMNVHLESTFHNGVLAVARGKNVATYSQNGTNATTTTTWLLSAY